MNSFLPITLEELVATGVKQADFVVITGDAYVDHPSFGAAIISRLLQSKGYSVAIIAQPDLREKGALKTFNRPKYGFFITGGNIDSMVAHYTVAKRRRDVDDYSPVNLKGRRPDRAVNVYSQAAKFAYPDCPVIIGGLEASLRRFAHYDYWADEVLPSILETSGADLLVYGMGEHQVEEIALRLSNGEPINSITNVKGTCFTATSETIPQNNLTLAGYSKLIADKTAYAKTAAIQLQNCEPITAKPLVQKQKSTFIVQNVPSFPLSRKELDAVYALPFTRAVHPCYERYGGVKAIEEVQFSIIQNRGCFGGCNFCAITLHQGRRVTSRSKESIVSEAKLIIEMPDFKGYIHDIGGATANFRLPSCKKQLTEGVCKNKQCLFPAPCKELLIDHLDYADILATVAALPRVKKVFIRSGLRYDYLMADKDETFMRQLVEHHISGQLKVAPEHSQKNVLSAMGKPGIECFLAFKSKFEARTKRLNKKQYLVPYIMSSHPACSMNDAKKLDEFLKENRLRPEQVQDFYPTPGTISTAMFYTGLDPYTLKPVYVARQNSDKSAQRALLKPFKNVKKNN